MQILTFNDCFLAAKIIADKVKCASGSYIGVYGVPFGGIIPAAMVAYHLRVPLVPEFRCVSAKDILVVDDTLITGRTLRRWNNCDTALITVCESQYAKCKYYGLIINDNVTFEWESKI